MKRKKNVYSNKEYLIFLGLHIVKGKLKMIYSDENITVTPHAEEVSMFTRQISDTRLSLLRLYGVYNSIS